MERKARTFAQLATEMVQLQKRKNEDYGNAFGKSFARFGMVAPAVRLNDKLARFERLMSREAKVNDESIKDTLIDLAAYALMTVEAIELQEAGQDEQIIHLSDSNE